ncbi:hypothetical protein [Aeromicrobium erythreum]|uniref:DUF304 domain-containing protein n=1 Tax=Aeromicrobium erythreum TaxID=2041 RepID=A0A0U3TKE2_9ACTN|nr:hypothetical protein [Aeromicrobium erythreum]ALX05975.1 hypothetical protein AERYTH_15345 [Aeromicrobium erythreum]
MSDPGRVEIAPAPWDPADLRSVLRRESLAMVLLLAFLLVVFRPALGGGWFVPSLIVLVHTVTTVVEYQAVRTERLVIGLDRVEYWIGFHRRRTVDLRSDVWVVLTRRTPENPRPSELVISDGRQGFHLSDPRWRTRFPAIVDAIGRPAQQAPRRRALRLVPEAYPWFERPSWTARLTQTVLVLFMLAVIAGAII